MEHQFLTIAKVNCTAVNMLKQCPDNWNIHRINIQENTLSQHELLALFPKISYFWKLLITSRTLNTTYNLVGWNGIWLVKK